MAASPSLRGRPAHDPEDRIAPLAPANPLPRGLCTKTYNTPSFRGGAAGGEPGIHIPEACVHGFRAASFCSAPGMTITVQSPPGERAGRVGLCTMIVPITYRYIA